eukprot:262127_1
MGSSVSSETKELFTDHCESIQACCSINRIIKYLNEYSTNPIQFVQTIHPYLADDFNHILMKHLTDNHLSVTRNRTFETIYDYIISNVQPCNLEKCEAFGRNNRNRETTDILSSLKPVQAKQIKKDNLFKYQLETMDTIHCYCMHSFDAGYRIQSTHFNMCTKDEKDELNADQITQKLYLYAKDKRARVQKIIGSQIELNSKFITNVENDSKQNIFLFGNEYEYWDDDRAENYVKPKHKDLKTEILHNKIFTVNKSVFNMIIDLAKAKLLSIYCKSLKVVDWIQWGRIQIGTPISLEQVAALLLYTELYELANHFRNTFISVKGSKIKDDKKRHSQYANWGRLLAETVGWFGMSTKKSHIGFYYHVISDKLILQSFCDKVNVPFSTSTQIAVALMFAGNNGLILELQNASKDRGFKYFNCSCLSSHSYEEERLFLQAKWDTHCLLIYGIRDMKMQKDYSVYMHALLTLTDLVGGISSDYNTWEESETDSYILTELFRHFDTSNVYKNKLPSYVNDMFAAFVKNRKENFYIYLIDINVKYPSLKPLFFDKDPMMFKLVNTLQIFNKCTFIRVIYGDYHSKKICFNEKYFNAFFKQINTLKDNKMILKQLEFEVLASLNPELFNKYKQKFSKLGYILTTKHREVAINPYGSDLALTYAGKSAMKSNTGKEMNYSMFNQQKRDKIEILLYSWIRQCTFKWNRRKYITFKLSNIIIDYFLCGEVRGTFPFGDNECYPFDIYWIEQNIKGELPSENCMIDIEYTAYCCQDKRGNNLYFKNKQKEFLKRRDIIQLNSNFNYILKIKALGKALLKINEGSIVKIFIHSKSAYGKQGLSKLKIPPNCDLLFDVKIHKVIKDTNIKEEKKNDCEINMYEEEINENTQKGHDKEYWTNKILSVIKTKKHVLELNGLSLQDVENMPWDLLKQCVSVTDLEMQSFPSNNEYYRAYFDVLEWNKKPPFNSFEDITNWFPHQIFEMKNIKKLNLSGYPFSYLPDNIGHLNNLEIFDITGSPILCLPSSIGKLKNLQKIDFYCSRRCRYVPYEILNCISLKSTKMGTSRLYANHKNNLLLPPLPKTN